MKARRFVLWRSMRAIAAVVSSTDDTWRERSRAAASRIVTRPPCGTRRPARPPALMRPRAVRKWRATRSANRKDDPVPAETGRGRWLGRWLANSSLVRVFHWFKSSFVYDTRFRRGSVPGGPLRAGEHDHRGNETPHQNHRRVAEDEV